MKRSSAHSPRALGWRMSIPGHIICINSCPAKIRKRAKRAINALAKYASASLGALRSFVGQKRPPQDDSRNKKGGLVGRLISYSLFLFYQFGWGEPARISKIYSVQHQRDARNRGVLGA
jgi:hypothetical protein